MSYSKPSLPRLPFLAAILSLAALTGQPVMAQTTYTWTNTAGGSRNWSDGTNWAGGLAPNPVAGDTVDFSTLNLAANTTLSLDADRTAGVWKFGDTTGGQTWTVNSGFAMTLAGPTPTINVPTAAVTLNNFVTGTAGFTKSGGGTLTLAATNNITGNVTITGGALTFSSLNSWGGSGKSVSFTGSGTLTSPDNYSAGQLSVATNVTATIAAANLTFATLTGSGTVIFSTGNKTLSLPDASAFQGSIRSSAGGNGQTIRFATIGDAPGAGNLQFGGGSGDSGQVITIGLYNDAGPLTLTNRRVEFQAKPNNWSFKTAILENNNANPTNTFVIKTALTNGTDRNHEFQFSGSNTGTNEFAGTIGDSTRGAYYATELGYLVLLKAGGGQWILSGTNTYTGPTRINGGTLGITTLGNVGTAGSLGNPTTVGNGTINIGSGSTAATLRNYGPGGSSDRVLNLAGTTGGATLNQSGTGLWKFTSNLTATGAGSKTITLAGSTTGIGELAGVIPDNNSTNLTSVTKSGTGTWVLSGTNTYSGETLVSGGALRLVDGIGLPTNSLLTLNGGAVEPVGNFARVAGTTAGKIRLIGGASGFTARGGDISVAIGTLASPAALVMGSATFVPGTLVLNTTTADSKLTFLNAVNLTGFAFQVQVGAATAEMSGVLSGDLSGSFAKLGAGTLILSGTNTFQGDATVSAGTLSLSRASLSQYANVTVANGAVLHLNFAGTNSVASLTLGDVPKAPGAYSSNNAAPFITGPGVIFVNGGDSDGDGMPDGWELLYGFNPNDPADAAADADGDGLTNLEEYIAGTDPKKADTDNDGLTDGQEIHGIIVGDEVVILGTSPLNPDSDGDGLLDGEEVAAGSNPLLADTDGDGAPDWYEVKAAFTNPADANSKPIVPYPLPRPTAATGATNKPVKVFILSGQSNMVGMGDVDPIGTPGTLSTFVKQQGRFPNFLNADGTWATNYNVWYRSVVTEIDNAPLTVGQGSGSAIGPELGFGRVLGFALDQPVLLIKAAQGNRALGWDFLPPGSPRYTYGANTYAGYGDLDDVWPTSGAPTSVGWYAGKQFDECFLNEADWSSAATTLGSAPIENVVDVLDNFTNQYPQWAAQGFEIAGYVWFQGNKDIGTGPPYTTRYETNLVNLIKQVRGYYANRYPAQCRTNAPFVIATGCGDPGTSGNGLVVANAQLAMNDTNKYPEFAGNVKTMDTRPYWRDVSQSPNSVQGYHYWRNAETFVLTGDALGRGMLELLGGYTDTNPPALVAVNPVAGATNVAIAANFTATFSEVIVVGTGNILLKNLTDNTITTIPVTNATQVTTFGSVLTINPAAYLRPNKQYAIRIPAGAIRDYTGNTFAGINDDVTWTFTSGQGDSLTTALFALTDHVNGIYILSSNQIAAHKATIDGLKNQMGDDDLVIGAAFDLVRAYETVYGPLWVASGQMTRSAETGNLQWAIYRVMQSIMDYVYTRGNIVAYPELLSGFKFNSSSNFPGFCPVPSATNVYSVLVNASFPDTFGRDTQGWTDRARRPTGAYLAPGTMATVTVPASLVNAGYKIRVGAHSWDFSNRPYIKRLDRSSLLFDIIGTEVKITSPLGGGIYIETPMNANAGVVTVTITGAARSPFFQNTSFRQTTAAEWINTERTNPGPWADYQTDKYLMQVPRSWIYASPDPTQMMADWDASMDAINDLMGFPRLRGKDTMYQQVDVVNRSSVFAPGYPTVNVSGFNGLVDSGGNVNHWLVRGPQYSPDYNFHEQGHSYFFTKFGGESESTVNLLYVPVLTQKFGYTMDAAFKRSFSPYNGNIPDVGFKDNVAKIWMTSFNFSPRQQPMANWEKSYQHQGHAKFVDIAQLYGWGALSSFWYYYNSNATYNITVPTDDDSLMVQLCKSAGADVRPLLHFWGLPPVNATSVSNQVAALGLTPPTEIYDLLVHYKSILPTNNASFQAFCLLYYGYQPTMNNAGVEKEHARQWSTNLLNGQCSCAQERFPTEIYDETAYAAVSGRVQQIIDLYYPTGRPPSNNARLADLVPNLGTFNPGFTGTTFSYSNVVPYSATSLILTPTASDPTATIRVNGSVVPSGSNSSPINVSAATTLINVVVESSDTTVTNTYTVTVTHAAASPNALLVNLVPNTGTLAPTFSSSITNYFTTVPFAVTNLTVTPTAAQSGATITVNGTPVASCVASGPIALNVGTNIITTVVVSENLGVTNTYVLTVRRTANAGLSNLIPSAGTLAPAFSTVNFSYTATVPYSVASFNVTPTAADPAANIKVNGSTVASGTASPATALVVGTNVFTTVVISADASATNTYVLTVTRVAPGSRWWDGGTNDIAGNGNAASAGGAGTWDTTLQNWDQGSNLTYSAWFNANDDTAIFGGTAGTVTLATNVSASGLRFDTANYILTNGVITLTSIATITNSANATIAATLAGTNGLTKVGAGTVTLSGSNTLTGTYAIGAGTLSFGNLNAWGGTGKNVTFTGNGTLNSAVAGYVGGQITVPTGVTGTVTTAGLTFAAPAGSGTIVNGSAATLDLGNASAFSGNLRVAAGVNNNQIKFTSVSDTPGAALQFQGGNSDSGQTATLQLYGDAGPLTFTNRQIQILPRAASNWELRDNILANNNSNAANKWIITTALAYTGGQWITAFGGSPETGRNFVLSGSNTGDNEFAGVISNGSNTNGLGLGKTGTGTWILSGTNTYSGPTAISAGTLVANNNSALGNGLVTLSGTPTLSNSIPGITLNNPINLAAAATVGVVTGANFTLTGVITNTFALTKTGAGSLSISGSNTYSGVTTVSGGKLFINGDQTAATNRVNIATNATLGGTGIIGGNTTVSNGARLEFTISTAAAGHDKLELAAGKTLTFSGGSTLTITSSGGGAVGAYALLTAPGGITGNAPTNVILPVGWTATVAKSGNDLVLNVTAVPAVGYSAWAGGAPFNSDANNDRVANGLAWVLGAANPSVNATALLPVGDGTIDASYYLYTYRRSDAAFADPQTSIIAQYSTDLTNWTNCVADGTNILITATDNFYAASPGVDKVEVKVKRTLAANGRIFLRLKVAVLP